MAYFYSLRGWLEVEPDNFPQVMGLNLSGYFHAQGEDGEENIVYNLTDDFLHVEEDVPKVEIT